MKKTEPYMRFILLFGFFALFSINTYAQKVTLAYQNVPFERVLNSIKQQTGLALVFSDQLVDVNRKVSINVKDAEVQSVLKQVLSGTNLDFEISNRKLYLIEKKRIPQNNPTPSKPVATNSKSITGTVIDEATGEPIIGASVVEKGTTNGVLTDTNGNFKLTVSENAILVVSSIGNETQEFQTKGQTNLKVVLSTSSKTLDEVVVIGYGSMRKQDLTGSIGQVKPRELALAPVASFDEALAGRVAGVQVSSYDGQPGGGTSIVIRGASSLTQSNSPLYVIDGVAVEEPDNSALNPEEIASMTVLKDASATAIYGSRASNGVIIIETKQGVSSKPTLSFNSSIGFQQPIKFIEMMNPYDFVKLQYEISESATNRIYLSGGLPEDHRDYNPNGRTWDDYKILKGINWQEQIFNTEPMQNYNISLRGRVQGTSYSISGSIFDQNGIVQSTGFNRYQGRITINQDVKSKLKVGLTANYSKGMRHGQRVNEGGGSHYTTYLLYRAWAYRPVAGDSEIDLLDLIDDPEHENVSDVRVNPLMSSQNEYDRMGSTVFSVSSNINYKINKDLTLRILGSYSTRNNTRTRFYNTKTSKATPLNRSNTEGIHGNYLSSIFNSLSNENTITYNKSILKRHNINTVGGVSYYTASRNAFGFSSQHISNEELKIFGLEEGVAYEPISGGGENVLLSYFGRINYNYKSTYLLTLSARYDGSSKFAKGNRWGFFPSAAFAWDIKNDLLKGVQFISASKIRLSYGFTGNNRVGDYDYLLRMALPISSSYSFGNNTPTQGTIPASIANKKLSWEKTKQKNIGFDFGLFKERILLNLDLYEKLTTNLLLNAELPGTTGQPRTMRNIGSMGNRGLELSLQTINISNPIFSWTSSFNISFNENKILGLTQNQNKLITNLVVVSHNAPLYISRVGYPAGMFFGYIFDGIYQIEDFDSPSEGVYILKNNLPDNGTDRTTVQPGHIKYKDLNNDGTIDSHDMAIIGRGQPIHYGGLTNNFYYKSFSLSLFFQWSYGNKIYNANRMAFEGGTGIYGLNAYASYNNRWTPENRSNLLYTARGFGPPGFQSSRVLEDGSYLRLKTLSFGYVLPKKVSNFLLTEEIAVKVASQNLFTWTKYSGMDPEVSVRHPILSPGYDYSAYPQARTFTFDLSITF